MVKAPAFQKVRNSCVHVIYHQVLDESVCDATKEILEKIKDGEPEKKSCPEGIN